MQGAPPGNRSRWRKARSKSAPRSRDSYPAIARVVRANRRPCLVAAVIGFSSPSSMPSAIAGRGRTFR